MKWLFLIVSSLATGQISYNINTYGSASTCTGLPAGDNAAFSAWLTAALAWQAGGGTGQVTLTIPQNGSVINISSISVSGTTVTVNTSGAHGWSTNQWVWFSGITGITGLNTSDGGLALQITVTSTTQFTVVATVTGTSASNGTVSSNGCTATSGLNFPFTSGSSSFGVTGLKNLKVTTSDGTLSTAVALINFGEFGAKGSNTVGPAGTYSCRTSSASIGSISVTCLMHSQAGIFTVGQYAMMGGIDMQDYGYAQNQAFWDFPLLSSVNSGTGAVAFSSTPLADGSPVTQSYESTWPVYNSGDMYHNDEGGPATLFWLDPSWGWTGEFDGFVISQSGQTYASGYSVTYKNVIFTGGNGPVPTENHNFSLINVTCALCNMEVDKMIDIVTFNNVKIHLVNGQSASVKSFNVTNGSVIGETSGTFRSLTCSNSDLGNFFIGTEFYGVSGPLSINNCSANPVSYTNGNAATSQFTMSGNVITWPNSQGAPYWAIPGSSFYGVGNAAGYPCKVIDLTQDATNTYISTTCSVGPPPIPGFKQFNPFPNTSVTAVGASGSQQMVDLNNACAQNQPLYTCSSITFSPITSQGPLYNLDPAWGLVQSITINVSTAYAGSDHASLTFCGAQFFTNVFNYSNNSTAQYQPCVNLKQSGVRVITPAGVTGTQTGDTGLTLPGPQTFLNAAFNPFLSGTISGAPDSCPGTPQAGCPTVTITIQTTQGQFSTSLNGNITVNGGITIK